MSNKHDEGREEWHASPKPKKPLSERLDSLSNKILSEQLAKAKEDFDKLHTASNLTLNELAKERELRKELVEGVRNYINHTHKYFKQPDIKQLEALIKKGT